jgi:hypothetical protein
MRKFESGAVRDSNEGKPRPDLISPLFKLRLGQHLALGAQHYGENNWQKGMSQEVLRESLERHLVSHDLGDKSEDHLSAAAFNLMAMIHFDEKEKRVFVEEFKEENQSTTIQNQKATLFKPEDVPDSNRDIQVYNGKVWHTAYYSDILGCYRWYYSSNGEHFTDEIEEPMFWRELKSNK